jgi:hypothetical protein
VFGGVVGLSITQAMGLTGMLQFGMRQSAELENIMTSVERVLEYSRLESEPPLDKPDGKHFVFLTSLLNLSHMLHNWLKIKTSKTQYQNYSVCISEIWQH